MGKESVRGGRVSSFCHCHYLELVFTGPGSAQGGNAFETAVLCPVACNRLRST